MSGLGDLLGPLLVWSAHFAALWIASSVWPDRPAARVAAVIATIAALTALWRLAIAIRARDDSDAFTAWLRTSGLLACGIAALSVVWQALPAALG